MVMKMDEEGFRKFLKGSGRSQSTLERALSYVRKFEQFLQEHRSITLEEVAPEDLEAFVEWIEEKPGTSAKLYLWGIRYYFTYTSNKKMSDWAGELREERIRTKRKPFQLKNFRGVSPENVKKLAAVGITNTEQMLEAGKTIGDRQELSERAGIPLDALVEFVKLSDLARIPGVKSTRARLYYDAGVDTAEKMAEWDPDALRTMLTEFVERTGFDGIPPTPKEAESTVETAQKLPKIVEY